MYALFHVFLSANVSKALCGSAVAWLVSAISICNSAVLVYDFGGWVIVFGGLVVWFLYDYGENGAVGN